MLGRQRAGSRATVPLATLRSDPMPMLKTVLAPEVQLGLELGLELGLGPGSHTRVLPRTPLRRPRYAVPSDGGRVQPVM